MFAIVDRRLTPIPDHMHICILYARNVQHVNEMLP
jgi:hypothetical protein